MNAPPRRFSTKRLPAQSAFSSRSSGQMLDQSKRVKAKELLPARRSPPGGNRRSPSGGKRRSPGTRGQRKRTPAPATAQQKAVPKTSDIIAQRLAEMDEKLKAEQARRLELEKHLRNQQVVNIPVESKAADKSVPPRQKKNVVRARISSPGTVLRRGSQVGKVSPTVRRYRHARDMENDMARVERELAATQMQLTNVTTLLHETQHSLSKRTSELERARSKVATLVGMVKQLMQHLLEKRDARRFSASQSADIQQMLDEPLEAAFDDGQDSKLDDYIDQKLNTITDMLPTWVSLYEDGNTSVSGIQTSGASSFAAHADSSEVPPPLPPGVKSRRAVSPASRVPLPPTSLSQSPPPPAPPLSPPPPTSPPSATPAQLIEDLWNDVDSSNHGVCTLQELQDRLADMSHIGAEVSGLIVRLVKRNAISHSDGSTMFGQQEFQEALTSDPAVLSGLMSADVQRRQQLHSPSSLKSPGKQSLQQWQRRMSIPEDGIPRSIHRHAKGKQRHS